MHLEALADERYFLDKPVEESTSKLVVTFLRNFFKKMEVDSQIFLTTKLSKIRYLKTGAALGNLNAEYLNTDLSEIPEGTPILAVWSSTWDCEEVNYYAEGSESGTRYDDVFLIDARVLEEACKTDNPQWGYHLDHHDIEAIEGDFKEIGLPEEGYHGYVAFILSSLDYSYYGDVDVEYAKQAHPIIRDYIAGQIAMHREEE